MEISGQKQNIDYLMTTKKYKLSFFGISPKHDWNVLFNFGVVLLIIASLLYYFDSQNIKKSTSSENLIREEKNYFNIEKAKNLLKNLETKKISVDQSL
jgi:hypothetical protein